VGLEHLSSAILYFEREGRHNLPQVLRVLRKVMKKRQDLRALKIAFLTAEGEGPALAYNLLQEFDPQIIAITFPPDFSVKRGDERYSPRIHEKVRRFFDGVGIKVITGRLPFDLIDQLDSHNQQMQLMCSVLSIVGGGFPLCVQAVLQSCDHGAVQIGEKVIAVSGDFAAVITASTTKLFLTKENGLVVNEILCKPRNLTRVRKQNSDVDASSGQLFESKQNTIEMTKTKGPAKLDSPSHKKE
jgi:hypothetical protein